MAAADLAEALEDELYALRLQLGETALPKPALDYLNDWAAPDKGWLRKFYKPGTDEAQFDLTPATEKAIAWLAQLSERQFIGTESRLLTLFDLLKQMSEVKAYRLAEAQAEGLLHQADLVSFLGAARQNAEASPVLPRLLDDEKVAARRSTAHAPGGPARRRWPARHGDVRNTARIIPSTLTWIKNNGVF